jgi:hypothetical protein
MRFQKKVLQKRNRDGPNAAASRFVRFAQNRNWRGYAQNSLWIMWINRAKKSKSGRFSMV